jgi:hypothetical protein
VSNLTTSLTSQNSQNQTANTYTQIYGENDNNNNNNNSSSGYKNGLEVLYMGEACVHFISGVVNGHAMYSTDDETYVTLYNNATIQLRASSGISVFGGYVRMYICMYVYAYLCMHVCMYVCMYVCMQCIARTTRHM